MITITRREALAFSAARTNASNSAKCASVSPGKPTMKVDRTETSGQDARSFSRIPR